VLSEAGILDLPDSADAPNAGARATDGGGQFVPLHAMVEDAERRHIRTALERTGGVS
jgi:hypothetical protein